MKQKFKVVALVSVICIIAAMFSGCGLLNDLKENQVLLKENGDLLYKNATYKKLENSEDLHFEYDYNEGATYYVSEKDEPILYAPISSRYCDISADKIFIDYYEEGIYCREDKFDYIKERIENGFTPEKYIYTYYVELDSDDWFAEYDFETKIHYLTDSDMNIIKDIFANSNVIPYDSDFGYNSDYWVEIYECSEDLLLRRQSFDILSLDGKYYLQKWDGQGNTSAYEVPPEYNKAFQKMLEDYADSEELF